MSHLISNVIRYETTLKLRNPQTLGIINKQTKKDSSVISHNSHNSELSIDSSRGIITCGAKIRNISSQRIKQDNSSKRLIGQFNENKQGYKDKLISQTSQKQKDSGLQKLIFKRSQSSQMNSTKTDSPRVCLFTQTANRLNSIKLSTQPSRYQCIANQKITMQSLLLQDRERLEKLVNSSQQNFKLITQKLSIQTSPTLTLTLNEQIYSSTNDTLTKQIAQKQLIIIKFSKQIKQLQVAKNQQTIQLNKIKQQNKKEMEDIKQKLTKLQKDYNCSNKVIQFMKQQNVKLNFEVRNLKSNINTSSTINSHKTVGQPTIQSQNIRIYRSFQRQQFSPRKPSYSIVKDKHQDELSIKKQLIEDQIKIIKRLQQSQKSLKSKNKILQCLLQENNQQIVKQKIQMMNKNFKQRY